MKSFSHPIHPKRMQPIQATYKESQSLKGLAKIRYDKEHKDSLSKYLELKERMQSLLQSGKKITPKQWKAEIQSLQSEYDSIGKEQTKTRISLCKSNQLQQEES